MSILDNIDCYVKRELSYFDLKIPGRNEVKVVQIETNYPLKCFEVWDYMKS